MFFTNVRWIRCADGDTCTFYVEGQKRKVRISGIDAPELKQPFGRESRNTMIKLIQSVKKIDLDCDGRSYDRIVCNVFGDQKNLGEVLVREGFAWDSPLYSKGRYAKMEAEARLGKRGLWNQDSPINPAEFRKKNRRRR